MTDKILYPDTPFELKDGLVLLTRRGSEAHGTYVKPDDPDAIDDRDLLGVVVPPKPFYLGMRQWDGAEAIKGVWDVVLYELRKAVRLFIDQNPNALSALWCEDEDVLITNTVGEALRENRHLFCQRKRAKDAFIGYARSQLKRMTAFDAQTMAHIDYLEQMLKDADIDPQHLLAEPPIQVPDWLGLVATEYRSMRKKYHKSYMGAKRWELVRRVGYDSKNASHMIRILHMGMEYLKTGDLQVRRTWDVEMLKEIKTGQWPLEKVQSYSDTLFAEAEDLHGILPDQIDHAFIDGMVTDLIGYQLGLP